MPDSVYARLLTLRTGLRRFERWSAQQAEAAGLTPMQHQLLLAIRGHGDPAGPTVGEAADYLLLRHHSAVGLVDRAEAAGLVRRNRSESDHRVVRLQLTSEGAKRLEALSALHLEEIERLALDLPSAWAGLAPTQPPHGLGKEPGAASGADALRVARIYDHPGPEARRILVDRLWPRGIARADAPVDDWMKDVAPSAALRAWYGHRPERFVEFARRYESELAVEPARTAVAELVAQLRAQPVVLVTATKDVEHSHAAVLHKVLLGT